MGKSCKMRWKTFKFWDLVHLVFEVSSLTINMHHHQHSLARILRESLYSKMILISTSNIYTSSCCICHPFCTFGINVCDSKRYFWPISLKFQCYLACSPKYLAKLFTECECLHGEFGHPGLSCMESSLDVSKSWHQKTLCLVHETAIHWRN